MKINIIKYSHREQLITYILAGDLIPQKLFDVKNFLVKIYNMKNFLDLR